MAAAPSSEVDWSLWDDGDLESKFEDYNKKFNPSQGADKMMFPSWKHFTGNMDFQFITNGDLFQVIHDCGSGAEGEETLKYAQFKTAVARLFSLEKIRTEANDELVTPLVDLLAPVVHSSATRRSIIRSLKSFFTFVSRHEETSSKIASEFGTTLKVMAKTAGKELTDTGISAPYIGICFGLLKKIWEYLEAYEKIPYELVKFATMLTYVFEALAFIESRELYSEKVTKKRLKGLEVILKQSKVLLEKAKRKCQKDFTKFLTAKKYAEDLKLREEEIRNWMSEISTMQLAETQQLTKDIHKGVGEIQLSNKDIQQGVRQNQQLNNDILLEVKKTNEKIARLTKGPRGAGGDIHETIPSQVQQDPEQPHNIQPENDTTSPLDPHLDHGEGDPPSYCIQDSPMTSLREEESIQRTPAGPVVRPRRRNQANSPSPLTSRTPMSGLQSDDSPTSRRNIRQNGVEPSGQGLTPTAPPESLPSTSNQSASGSQVAAAPTERETPAEPVTRTPPSHTTRTAPPESSPSTSNQPAAESQVAAASPGAPAEPATMPPPETPPPNTTSSGDLVLRDDKTIVDVLQWVSDNFGITDFSFFARALPGQSRLTTKDIQNATYPLHRDHSLSERNMAILEYWQEGNPDHCNITTIHKKLIDCRKNELARKLKREFTNQ